MNPHPFTVFTPTECQGLIEALRQPLPWVQYSDPLFEFRKKTLSEKKGMPPLLVKALDRAMEYCPAGLQPDPNWATAGFLWGGGAHVTDPGGYLAMHRDFNVLPTSYKEPIQMERCSNLIVYLNHARGGELCLEDGTEISPTPGKGVLFDPRGVFHGHPWPLRSSEPRYSLAVYFYRARPVDSAEWRSTQYQPLPFLEPTRQYQEALEARADPRRRYQKWWPEALTS